MSSTNQTSQPQTQTSSQNQQSTQQQTASQQQQPQQNQNQQKKSSTTDRVIDREGLKGPMQNLTDCYAIDLSLKTDTRQVPENTNVCITLPVACDLLRSSLKVELSPTNVLSDDNDSIDELSASEYCTQTENLAASTNLETELNNVSNDELSASEYCTQTENLAAFTNLETELNPTTTEESQSVDTDVYYCIPRKKKKFIKETESSSSSVLDKALSFLKEQPTDTERMDATELMFLGYAKQINTFSATRQAHTNLKISQFVMEQNLMQRVEDEEKPKCLENADMDEFFNSI